MASCKRCNKEDKNKKRVFVCDECKACKTCGGYKASPKAKQCMNCNSKDESYRKNLSESCKGKKSWSKGFTKETHPALKSISDKKKGKPSWNKGLTKHDHPSIMIISEKKVGNKLTEKTKEKISEAKRGKRGHPTTEETKEKLRNKLIERIKRGEINGSPKCSIYEYKDHKVQGRSELKWIKENYDKVVKRKKEGINTPHGYYFPDFETESYYVEIKSRYTYNLMLNKKQFEKIKYVSKSHKQVKIFIDEGKEWTVVLPE
jgi:hypothetical protein